MFTKVVNMKKKIVIPDGSFKEYTEVFAKGEYPAGDFIGQRLTDVSSGTVYAWDGSAWQTQGGGGGGSVPEGCILEYTFDEQSFADTSGGEHDGTKGGATFVPGIIGEYAATRTSGALSAFPTGVITSLPITFSFFLEFPNEITEMNYALYWYSSAVHALMVCVLDGDGLKTQGGTECPFAPGEIVHVAFTIDENKAGNTYVNGELKSSGYSCNYPQNGVEYPYFMNSNQTSGKWFGKFDQFRIFNRILTIEEIQMLANERNW